MKKESRRGRLFGRKFAALLTLLALLMTFFDTAAVFAQEQVVPNAYVVQSGDSLCRIAKKQLGNEGRWREIYELNKAGIADPTVIYKGQLFVLPSAAAVDVPGVPVLDEQTQAVLLADQLYLKAEGAEPFVTAVLKTMESDKAHLVGLDFRLKTRESLSRKIVSDSHDMEVSIGDAAGNIKDSLRYTLCIDDDDYITVTKSAIDRMKGMGFTLYAFKNYWANDSTGYQGINTNFKTPDGKIVFELQFHTPDSYDAKESKTHKYYEIQRSESSTEAEKAEAVRKMNEIFALVPVPAGVRDLKY